ncbi:MAG: cold-shock protein, partial [Pseudomonadales bacterium]
PRQASPQPRERADAPQSRSNRPADNGESRGRSRPSERPSRPEPAAEGPREQGTVKWFNRTKGFGFVIRESGDEIFVHQRSIRSIGEGDERRRPALRDGQSVSFYVAEREKGLQAEDVVPTEE